jgi:nucleolar protein 53
VDICKLRRIKPPVYYHKKPSGLTVVEVAPPGASYNPAYDDHQELLSKALVIEEAKTKEEERIARAMDDKFPLAGDVPNESTWLKEMSIGLLDDNEDEGSKPDFTAEELSQLSNNPPVRREDKKTEKERRRLKEIEVKGKNVIKAKKENLRKQELFRLKSIKREVKQRVTNLAARKEKRRLEKEANKDKTKKLGKIKFAEPTMALKLSEELEGSLRLLKPEGHILEDRFKSLQRRNIIEPRLRAKRIRRYTPKIIEKKGHRAVTE